jgi:hypothetical protein
MAPMIETASRAQIAIAVRTIATNSGRSVGQRGLRSGAPVWTTSFGCRAYIGFSGSDRHEGGGAMVCDRPRLYQLRRAGRESVSAGGLGAMHKRFAPDWCIGRRRRLR